MGIFGSRPPRRVPPGHRLGRELAHENHAGWRKLVLVRHGQTDFNVQHRLPGQLPGIQLNEEGKLQAAATAHAPGGPAPCRDRCLTARTHNGGVGSLSQRGAWAGDPPGR